MLAALTRSQDQTLLLLLFRRAFPSMRRDQHRPYSFVEYILQSFLPSRYVSSAPALPPRIRLTYVLLLASRYLTAPISLAQADPIA